MSTIVALPDELVEQVKSVTAMDLDQFLVNAVRKELRQLRAQRLRREYERTHARLTPSQVYERTLVDVVAFENKYKLSSDQFLRDFEAGVIDEDRDDWVAFYRWRTLAYGLRDMEKEYGFTREAQSGRREQT
ncbi:MAG: hypothetical protein BroJett039_11260 [Chloroflexota bacterium]|nr:MAG: hypothetical protein BroJett039_11260 [Chloroflexota bacterium]